MKFLIIVLGVMPVAARAECLSDGCYDGLVAALIAYAALALVIVAGLIFVAFKIGKRHGWRRGAGFLMAVVLSGYALVSIF